MRWRLRSVQKVASSAACTRSSHAISITSGEAELSDELAELVLAGSGTLCASAAHAPAAHCPSMEFIRPSPPERPCALSLKCMASAAGGVPTATDGVGGGFEEMGVKRRTIGSASVRMPNCSCTHSFEEPSALPPDAPPFTPVPLLLRPRAPPPPCLSFVSLGQSALKRSMAPKRAAARGCMHCSKSHMAKVCRPSLKAGRSSLRSASS